MVNVTYSLCKQGSVAIHDGSKRPEILSWGNLQTIIANVKVRRAILGVKIGNLERYEGAMAFLLENKQGDTNVFTSEQTRVRRH